MRLFIATSFPEAITRDLNARVAGLKPRLAAAAWVRPGSQHLTFAFLGEQDEAVIGRLAPAVAQRLSSIDRFAARLRGAGFFPNRRRARVGWAGLEPEQPFLDIAAAVRDAVTANGATLDRADFKPHLTLLRIRDAWPPACIEVFEHGFATYESEPFVVDTVTLYSSELNPSGAVHSPVREFPLA
ncbi:MAG TPA: RNA 2',3'-cyclic phosphodiesterase [Thermoanaerobaculia bacterium]|nr:RNA 2',3'-cyclic phosphodiesterase [Thermoanaerobaculia bacterium]